MGFEMKIGELSRRLGVAPSKIRFLETTGLITPAARLKNGYREYGADDEDTLRLILLAQNLGFKLDEIRKTFAERKIEDIPCDEFIQRLEVKLGEIDRQIGRLSDMKTKVSGVLEEMRQRRSVFACPDSRHQGA